MAVEVGKAPLVAIELTRLGDAIATVRPLLLVQKLFRPPALHIVVGNGYASFFGALFPDAVVHGIDSSRRARSLLSAAQEIRKVRPALAVSWSPSARNGIMARMCGARERAGYLGVRGNETPFLDRHRVTSTFGRPSPPISFTLENIERRPRKVLEILGIPPGENPEKQLPTPMAWPVRTASPRTEPRVVIHPFARWKYREWPLERFRDLIRSILDTSNMTVEVVGEKVDEQRMEHLRVNGFGQDRLRFSVPTDLAGLADLVAGATLFIGTDSGPLHLASLFGVPSVGLFGPAPPSLTAPLSGQGTFLYHSVSCSPCRQRQCVRPSDSCMHEISVQEVTSLVAARLIGNHARITAA
jgi:ADP-heptose:LPS heptosyltransferase